MGVYLAVALAKRANMMAIIYTTPTCAYCPRVKKFLTDNLIEYVERDASDPEIGKEAFALSGAYTVPVTLIKDKVIVGWNYAKLKEAIA